MKKVLLIALMISGARLAAMEQNQKPFPWEQLLPELKGEVLNQLINAPTVVQAIKNLQNLRFVNKDFYNKFTSNKAVLFNVLNTINQYFPGSEVLIARTLNTKLAEEWLKSVNPNASFKIIPTTQEQFNTALTYIQNNDLNSLKKWLEQGYDPKYRQFNGWTLASYAVEYFPSVAALELIGNYNPDIFNPNNIQTLLFLAKKALLDLDAPAAYSEKLSLVVDYLEQKLYQQLSQEQAIKIINAIEAQAKQQLRLQ